MFNIDYENENDQDETMTRAINPSKLQQISIDHESRQKLIEIEDAATISESEKKPSIIIENNPIKLWASKESKVNINE